MSLLFLLLYFSYIFFFVLFTIVVFCFFFFFFSSRRRHTRCLSDWSSDVCSSDLPVIGSVPWSVPGELLSKASSRLSVERAMRVVGVTRSSSRSTPGRQRGPAPRRPEAGSERERTGFHRTSGIDLSPLGNTPGGRRAKGPVFRPRAAGRHAHASAGARRRTGPWARGTGRERPGRNGPAGGRSGRPARRRAGSGPCGLLAPYCPAVVGAGGVCKSFPMCSGNRADPLSASPSSGEMYAAQSRP